MISYEDLGRKVDSATRGKAQAEEFVTEMGGPQAVAKRIGVSVDQGTTHQPGAMYLSEVLSEMVQEKADAMIQEAIRRLDERADTAREEFARAMAGVKPSRKPPANA